MRLVVKLLDESLSEFYENHTTYHPGDVGIDLFVPHDTVLKPHGTTIINMGIACEAFDDKGHNVAYCLYPRSSIISTPLRLANSVGIIDAGYRGPIKCALDNRSSHEYELRRGVRLVQICSPNLGNISFQLKDELSNSSRGMSGFGSTGQ